MPTKVIVTFDRVNDAQLYYPGHLIHNWSRGVRRDLHLAIVAAAPVNKRANKSKHPATYGGPTEVGHLKANIEAEEVQRTNARGLAFRVVSKAKYTKAVLFGTHGGTKVGQNRVLRQQRNQFGQFTSVFSDKPFYRIPFNGPGRGAKKVYKFRGQRANNFFEKGYAVAAAKHPALR